MATASPSCKAMLTAWLEFVGCHIVQEGDTYYETKQFPASASSPSFASWLLRSVWCQPSTSVHRSTYQVPEYSLSFQADIFWGAPSAHRELGPLFAKLRGDVRAVYAPGEADSPMSKFVASPEHLATFLEEIWRRQKVPDEWTDSKHCILMHNFGFNLLERVLIRRLALYGLYLGINANDNIKRRTPINAVCAIRLKMTTNPGGHHMAMIARLSDLGVPVGFVTIVRSFFKTIAPEKDPPQLSAFLFDWAVELLMAKSGVTASARWQIGFRDYVLVHDSIDELHFAVEELRRNSAEYGVRIGTAQSLVVRKRGLPKLDVDGLREVEGFGGLSDFVGIKRDVAEMPPLLGCHDFWGCGENSTLERCGAIPFNSDVFLAVEWFDVLVGRLRPFGYEDCKTELRILIASVRFSEEESDQENMKKIRRRRRGSHTTAKRPGDNGSTASRRGTRIRIPILSWFEDNYVGRPTRSGRRRPALFPIEMWSVYARTKDGTVRTNNYSEAAHRRIQAEFQMQHPTIWKFIDALRQVQASRDTAYEAMVRGDPPPKKRKLYQLIDERLLRIITNFDESEPDGNIEEFLRGCAHNFQMDP
ncbi:hypothetical protein QR680_012789 [Steinernema hermaphroditum]|uniref:Uncharacterized protein n=1 Tax=Steinernema hermaphroditum TaxID=289476 RepID=A0AA39I5A4_9BILA|nr:hypothetical protein QR680_012789 [Steinernema hermaphroditum]